MKRLFLLLIPAVLFAKFINAQKLTSDTLSLTMSYQYYAKKRDTYNTIGWVCLGSGLTLAGIGLLVDIGSGFNHGNISKGDGIAVTGEVVALASIPFFIIAHHNKKKASLYFRKESATINDRPLYKTNYTSISVAINF